MRLVGIFLKLKGVYLFLVLVLIFYFFHTYRRWNKFKHAQANSSYVTLCPARLGGYHRTGNHLFMLSAVLDLATKTSREVIMPEKGWFLDNVFDFKQVKGINSKYDFVVHRYGGKKYCPCEIIQTPHFGYDNRFNQTTFLEHYIFENNSTSKVTLEICGLSQTYLHTLNPEVEKRMFTLPRLLKDNAFDNALEIKKIVKKMMINNKLSSFALYSYNGLQDNLTSYIPLTSFNALRSEDTKEPILVGVHVRMGDFLHKSHADYGLTVADGRFFQKAFDLFVKLYKKVIFVILSDDIDWVTEHFQDYVGIKNATNNETTTTNEETFNQNDVKIIFFRDTLAQDFALLCRSDGLIISTGTFGWWAGWFNRDAKVVYYENYPRPNTALGNRLNKNSYYLKQWIPMS